MALSTTAATTMLDAVAVDADYASLHTADPGSTGASEVTGGSPAYARQAITWNAASAGNLDSSNAPNFDVPSGTTITHWGVWSASSGGTFLFGGSLSAPESYGSQGDYTLTDADYTLS
ncbi:hypothetical protein BJF79_13860 [Actinomadura sp. CNU-125]|uniref:phage tail fiber protein n=1 Tax=Actinomadura sp. CNU-125 TaxID=1904961 RepID=UPI000969DC86|nr:hypothetical protein [Actinomadura sp. CNU-125]OLT24423.1 hypothetical protein BJF79_13860 [Actinomadura sp. CNU-125]